MSTSNGNPNPKLVITQEELGLHAEQDNAWIALNGKVYDITKYISKHPGGVAPISRGLGKDATDMFNSVHPYVKYDKILSGHQVGILEGSASKSDSNMREKQKLRKRGGCFSCCSSKDDSEESQPDTKLFESESSLTYVVMFPSKKISSIHDWTVGIMEKKILMIKKVVNRSDVVVIHMKLTQPLVDDTIYIQFDAEWKVLELTLTKPVPGHPWHKIGEPEADNNTVMDSRATSDSYEAYVAYKKRLTGNVSLFGLRLKASAHLGIPMGFHTTIYIGDADKPYTPVCYSIFGDPEPNLGAVQGQVIWYIIKIYDEGRGTPKLDMLPVITPKPDSPKQEFQLRIGSPGGSFDMEFLSDVEVEAVLLLAGGTGITPMTKIIKWHLEKVKKAEIFRHVVLIYWNKTEDDIIWKDVWEALAKKESKWFHFIPVCTEPSPKWTGLTGRPSGQLIQGIIDSLPKGVANSKTKQAYVCGSPGFNTAVEKSLTGGHEIVPLEHMHIFAG